MSSLESALDLLYGLVLDDGRRWGEAAVEFQVEDATAILTPPHGDPVAHFLTRPKGGSKSTDLAAVMIAYLLRQALPLSEGYALAADGEQAGRLIQKVRGFVARTPDLARELEITRRTITAPNGATIEALPADVSGNQGLLSPFIVVDEVANWAATPGPRAIWDSVLSDIPKWRGPNGERGRLAVITHAGDPAHWAYTALQLARTDAEGFWQVREVPGPLPWRSKRDLSVQRRSLTDSVFRRRHLNEWVSGEDRLVSVDDLEACIVLPGELPPQAGLRYTMGLDIGTANDATVVVVAHQEPQRNASGERIGTHIVVDCVRSWSGTRALNVDLREVEAELADLGRQYRATLYYDPSQAIGMVQRLESRGITAVRFDFTAQSVGKLASGLLNALRTRQLHLPRHPKLYDELLTVRLRPNAYGVVRIDHDPGRHDDHVIALGLAAYPLLEERSTAADYFEALLAEQSGRTTGSLDRPDFGGYICRVCARRMGSPPPGTCPNCRSNDGFLRLIPAAPDPLAQ